MPTTSNLKTVRDYEVVLVIEGKRSKGLADQIRTVAKERLRRPAGRITSREMAEIEKAIRLQLDL